MRRHIEQGCKDDRFEQHRYNILDLSDATSFSRTGRQLLINSGVLIGAGRLALRISDGARLVVIG
jgi:hypothetical protein